MPDSPQSGQNNDLCFILKKPFPEIILRYPEFEVRPAVASAIENDFLLVISDAYGPPLMTHDLFELDIAEGWYTREDCFVMYDGETPVAAGQIRTEMQNEILVGFLDTLGVPKDIQGNGYGAELTKCRIQILLKLGVSEIRTEVEQNNQPMLKLLLKLGFTRV
jgi:RimJ/RimL family protein N-acetyltransferase